MSAMSEACPMCGTPTNENAQTANTSSKNETEKCEQTFNVSILKSGKRVYWGVAAVLTILFIVYVGYKVGNRQDKSKEVVTNVRQVNGEQHDALDDVTTSEMIVDSYDIAYNTLSRSGILPSEKKELIWTVLVSDSKNKEILAFVGPVHGMDFKFDFVRIEYIGGNWQVSNIDTLPIGSGMAGGIINVKASDFNMQDEEMPKYVKLNNVPYVFFMCREGNAGNAMPPCYGTLYFALYNLKTKRIVTLDFNCWSVYSEINGKHVESVEGEFVGLDEIKKYTVEAEYLLKQAESSAYIYRPTADDLNLELSQNAVKKWLKDNPQIDNLRDNDSAVIRFTYYDKDKSYEEAKRSTMSITPNEDYEIFYSWRGSVYGLNKKQQKYFVIYGHESNWGAREVSWTDKSTIEIKLDSGVTLMVDLKSGNVHSQMRY